jgi:hypothetical protein
LFFAGAVLLVFDYDPLFKVQISFFLILSVYPKKEVGEFSVFGVLWFFSEQ